MTRSSGVIVGLVALGALAFGAFSSCSARGDAAFFRGKTVTVIVPHAKGGMDTYARAVAPYLARQLPGSKIEVRNVPGEGSILGKNLVFEAEPDGLTLGFATTAGNLLAEWAGQPGISYKTSEFSLIGRVNAEAHVLAVSPASGYRNLGDLLRAGKFSMGFAGVGSDDYYVGLIAARLLGLQVEARADYSSSLDASFACVKGLVDAVLFSESSLRPQLEAGTLVAVAVFGGRRLPSLSSVPTIYEAAAPGDQAFLRTLVKIYELDRTFYAPPGLPESRLAALREAFDRVMADAEFIHDMEALRRPLAPLSGTACAGLLSEILASESRIKPMVAGLAAGGR